MLDWLEQWIKILFLTICLRPFRNYPADAAKVNEEALKKNFSNNFRRPVKTLLKLFEKKRYLWKFVSIFQTNLRTAGLKLSDERYDCYFKRNRKQIQSFCFSSFFPKIPLA